MDDTDIIEMLVSGVAAVGAAAGGIPVDHQDAVGIIVTAGGTAFAEWVIRVAGGGQAVMIGSGDQAAQMVFVPVFDLV